MAVTVKNFIYNGKFTNLYYVVKTILTNDNYCQRKYLSEMFDDWHYFRNIQLKLGDDLINTKEGNKSYFSISPDLYETYVDAMWSIDKQPIRWTDIPKKVEPKNNVHYVHYDMEVESMDMKTAKQILNENGFLLEDTNTKSLVGKFWAAKKNGETLSKEDAEDLLNAPDFDEVVNPKYKNYILAVCRKVLGVAKPEKPSEEKPAVEEQPKTKDLRDPKTGLPPVDKENFFKLWPEGYVCPWYGNFRKNSKNYEKFKEMQTELDKAVWAYNQSQEDKLGVDVEDICKKIIDKLDVDVQNSDVSKNGSVRIYWKPTEEDLSNKEYNEKHRIDLEHTNIRCQYDFSVTIKAVHEDWIQKAIWAWEPEHRKEYAGSKSSQLHWNYPVDHYEVKLSVSKQAGPNAPDDGYSGERSVDIDPNNIVEDGAKIINKLIADGYYNVFDPDRRDSVVRKSEWLSYDDYKLKRWGHWH